MRICIEVKDNKTQHFRLFVEFPSPLVHLP